MTDLVRYEVTGGITVLTLIRPHQRNAVDAAPADAGPIFCAGMRGKAKQKPGKRAAE